MTSYNASEIGQIGAGLQAVQPLQGSGGTLESARQSMNVQFQAAQPVQVEAQPAPSVSLSPMELGR